MKTAYYRVLGQLLMLGALIFSAAPAWAKKAPFQIDYTVKVASIDHHLFHVTTEIKNIDESHMILSLPTWTPGWYTIENYGKNILRFKITDGKGNSVPSQLVRKQSWRVSTKDIDTIRVEFDYRAEILALNQAKITEDFAFFTGTQLFLMAENHRNSSSSVRFELPAGWKILSALKETADPMIFTAPDYDTLVDAPTEMGNFDVTKFEVDGKPHYFAATPAGTFSKEKTDLFIELMKRVVQTESAIFHGQPYDKYVYFYFFARPESNAGGALEHQNSHVLFGPPGQYALPESIIDTAAHEFFHAWNVKRIRPIEMWPYDYSRENETPLLWVSEGFTSYYSTLTLLRAGIIDEKTFLQALGRTIAGVENNEAHKYISPADASTSTWIGYDTPTAFGISYYTQGMNLAALLDISLRHDTGGKAGLDDVMRTLYQDFYQAGKGFSIDDLRKVINRIGKRSYDEFFEKYVVGVAPLPYEQIYQEAGLDVGRKITRNVVMGFDTIVNADSNVQVTRVEPGSTAAAAGLRAGDVLLKVDELEIRRKAREVYSRMQEKIGSNIKLLIFRDGVEEILTMTVATHEETSFSLAPMVNATTAQTQVRAGWLQQSGKAAVAGQ